MRSAQVDGFQLVDSKACGVQIKGRRANACPKDRMLLEEPALQHPSVEKGSLMLSDRKIKSSAVVYCSEVPVSFARWEMRIDWKFHIT